MYATKLYHQELEVVAKLAAEFSGTTIADWTLILEKVVAATAEAVPDDPRSAAGILGYIHGVRNVRGMLKPKGYESYSEQNIESARDPATGKQVVYQNVDCAGLVRTYVATTPRFRASSASMNCFTAARMMPVSGAPSRAAL